VSINPISIDLYFETRPHTPLKESLNHHLTLLQSKSTLFFLSEKYKSDFMCDMKANCRCMQFQVKFQVQQESLMNAWTKLRYLGSCLEIQVNFWTTFLTSFANFFDFFCILMVVASCRNKYYGTHFISAVPTSLLIAPGLRTIQFLFLLAAGVWGCGGRKAY
jgi:hypothetical protein